MTGRVMLVFPPIAHAIASDQNVVFSQPSGGSLVGMYARKRAKA